MKKITVFALLLVMLASFAACRKNDPAPETTAPQTTAPSSEPITMPTMPDMTMPSSNIPDPTVDSNSGNQETEATNQ